jgi:membrane associated rhomboid family serine protease
MMRMAIAPDSLLKPWMWWQFVTACFAHDPSRIGHIIGNMFSLYIFGRDVEEKLGRWEFLRFYLITGAVANVVFAVLHNTGILPPTLGGLGASGSVSAVTILCACYFPDKIILLMMVLPIKCWIFAIIMVGQDMYGATSAKKPGEPIVGHDVHLSAAALALAYWYFHWNFAWLDPSQLLGGIKTWLSRPRLKIHKPSPSHEDLEAERDRLLEKVLQQGEASLTARERKVLEDYSRQMKQKHR